MPSSKTFATWVFDFPFFNNNIAFSLKSTLVDLFFLFYQKYILFLSLTLESAIVGLRTGLRASDFLKLDAQNIKGGYMEVQTQKTGYKVVIPLHPQLKAVLDKTGGLPQRISDQSFNTYFKEVCKTSGHFAREGRLFDESQNKKKGRWGGSKYKLVSSHTC